MTASVTRRPSGAAKTIAGATLACQIRSRVWAAQRVYALPVAASEVHE